ncbi:hypothetical protein CPJCM30710_17980 [Clostridium polyendosporum]|uniref:Uncharacterized protein n=1 Tax=Clostridium polyendosporum TaxID=69208 RepID=A0A919VGF3_9CLOT|nr:hypothetical protein [Clostridium polyendosporum]GIM29132.1 hypothetical protein CPJCM30710_17980 [Clostridium polyendosporum]
MEINNSQELIEKLSIKMSNTYNEYKKSTRSGTDNTLLKSYLIETHLLNTCSDYDNICETLRNTIINYAEINETKEENLFLIKKDSLEMYLDINNKRFWKMHTISQVKNSDNFIDHLTKKEGFDKLWLPSRFIRNFSKSKYLYGVKVGFCDGLSQNDFFEDDNNDYNLELNKGFSGLANKFLDLLESSSDFKNKIALSKIQILSGKGKDEFVIDDIKYSGKVTAKGNSFIEHDNNLEELIRDYEKLIDHIEEKMALGIYDGAIGGVPIEIIFDKKDISITSLVKLIFTGKEPFKLLGFVEQMSDEYARISAVDLHNGNYGKKINFEISSIGMNVFISRGVCGNSIMRLCTNLSRFIDPNIMVRGYDIDDIYSIIRE